MKRIFFLSLFVLMAILMGITISHAGSKTLEFGWQQTLPSPNDLQGWGLYQSSTPGGPYTKIQDIVFVSQQTEYTGSQPITVPDGQVTVLYFVIDAVDTSGNRSEKSNEVRVDIDFQSPQIPIQFRLRAITSP